MTHKFDVNKKKKLDNEKRREMLPVDTVLREIGLKEGDRFADIGCGIGYFSLPAATIVGANGVVYALDIEEEMLLEVHKKMNENLLDNIRTFKTEEYEFKLEDQSATFAFLCTVLHEIEDHQRFLNETRRLLSKTGRIAVVEWIKSESDYGPPINHRIDSSDLKKELKTAGFHDIHMTQLNSYFYIVMATKDAVEVY
ncbi:MAG: class I SAM-dependent methyltransferase [Velocimicrobium sp.]